MSLSAVLIIAICVLVGYVVAAGTGALIGLLIGLLIAVPNRTRW